ncbi:MAG TPA: hypothetical protein VFS67_16720 [Polyangiaceae bacterium]|nr:hypothetical protein [Polyangiaceae bacterium]
MRARIAALSCLVCWLLAFAARAQDNPRTDYTAYTRPAGRTAIGLFKIEQGIVDALTIGTYWPLWTAYPALGVLVPNVYVKMGTPNRAPLALAGRAGVTYVDDSAITKLSDDQASASAIAYAAEVTASLRLGSAFTFSLGGDYNHISAVGGATDHVAPSIEGASTADTWSARLFTEWHLTHSFELSLLVRYLIYQSPLNADVATESEAVSIESDLSGEASRRRRWSLVPGVAFEGERWELQLGVGYGVFYLPVLGLPTSKSWPIVDLGFAYRFDLY